MQPKVLHLPDSLRDRLEAGLHEAARLPAEEARRAAEENAVQEILYPAEIASEDQAFLEQFQQAMRHVYHGTGTPALTLENLPPTTGELLSEALHRLLGDGADHIIPVAGTHPQEPHHDHGALPADEVAQAEQKTNNLVILYCKHPGAVPQPTVFITADEIIDRWAHERQQAGEDMAEARQHIIARLSAATALQGSQPGPLLSRNAGFTPGCGAPEFLLYSPHQCRITEAGGAPQGVSLSATLKHLVETLRDEKAKTSATNTKANTLTVVNDMLLLHGRGPCIGEGEQEGRTVIGMDAGNPSSEKGAASPFLQVAFGERAGHCISRVRALT